MCNFSELLPNVNPFSLQMEFYLHPIQQLLSVQCKQHEMSSTVLNLKYLNLEEYRCVKSVAEIDLRHLKNTFIVALRAFVRIKRKRPYAFSVWIGTTILNQTHVVWQHTSQVASHVTLGRSHAGIKDRILSLKMEVS